jgi:LPXTG-motif cell wall-anchored protein
MTRAFAAVLALVGPTGAVDQVAAPVEKEPLAAAPASAPIRPSNTSGLAIAGVAALALIVGVGLFGRRRQT